MRTDLALRVSVQATCTHPVISRVRAAMEQVLAEATMSGSTVFACPPLVSASKTLFRVYLFVYWRLEWVHYTLLATFLLARLLSYFAISVHCSLTYCIILLHHIPTRTMTFVICFTFAWDIFRVYLFVYWPLKVFIILYLKLLVPCLYAVILICALNRTCTILLRLW